jgi:hypothetical protein
MRRNLSVGGAVAQCRGMFQVRPKVLVLPTVDFQEDWSEPFRFGGVPGPVLTRRVPWVSRRTRAFGRSLHKKPQGGIPALSSWLLPRAGSPGALSYYRRSRPSAYCSISALSSGGKSPPEQRVAVASVAVMIRLLHRLPPPSWSEFRRRPVAGPPRPYLPFLMIGRSHMRRSFVSRLEDGRYDRGVRPLDAHVAHVRHSGQFGKGGVVRVVHASDPSLESV